MTIGKHIWWLIVSSEQQEIIIDIVMIINVFHYFSWKLKKTNSVFHEVIKPNDSQWSVDSVSQRKHEKKLAAAAAATTSKIDKPRGIPIYSISVLSQHLFNYKLWQRDTKTKTKTRPKRIKYEKNCDT